MLWKGPVLAAVAAAAMMASAATASAQVVLKPIDQDPIAVDGGMVSGTWLPSGVKAWLGVPYAAPPVRENRWRAPQPVQPWSGVYTADRFHPECIQGLRSPSSNHYAGEEATSEDCLYLNIWAPPAARAGDRLPVVVWIYGGGFGIGSANMPLYRGESLAKKGVIYVGLNYRLGVFGFLAHPGLSAESGHSASGDWGFLDQVSALRWVNSNIAKFGGDPANVTIIGQSAGSMSVNALQASPLAKGLFGKAFGMSGSFLAAPSLMTPLAQGEAQGLKLQAAMKAASVDDMRGFSSDKVVAAAAAAGVRTGPVVDGWFLPRSVPEIFAAHQQSDVPVVTGSTANDIGTETPVRAAIDLAGYRDAAARMYGADAAAFLKLFPASDDAQARAEGLRAGVESGFGQAARSWARAQTEDGKAPVWLYLFSRVHPYAPGVVFSDHDPNTAGAYHAGDIGYWLQTFDALNLFRVTRNWTPWDRKLADDMSDVVVAFARTGAPSTPKLKLVRYDSATEPYVELGDVIRRERIDTAGADFIAAHPLPFGPGAAPQKPATREAPKY